MYGREGESFSLAAAGDAILTRRLSPCEDPQLEALRGRIREADAGFANLEVLVHDYAGHPAADSGGTYMRAPPAVLEELDWLGFDLLSAATNHAGDYGEGGMEATMSALEARDWTYAGLGRSLALARRPAYLDTPAGRVALVSVCSTVTRGTVAGEQRPDLQGRPGVAPLRLETTYRVPEADLDRLREVSETLGLEAEKRRLADLGFPYPGEEEDGFVLPNVGGEDVAFDTGETPGVERTVDEEDLAAVRRRVREADRQADWVLVSLHAHEGAGPRHNDETVPEFAVEFAHEVVDAGADAVLGHGPHVLRGIEVYEGAPVCYSLGDFVMGNETVTRLPADIYERYDLDPLSATPADLFDVRVFEDDERVGFLADRDYWESVLAVPAFSEGSLDRVELHPVDLGFEAPRPQRGRPLLAEGERAAAILDRVADRSERFGTELRVEDGVGIVEA